MTILISQNKSMEEVITLHETLQARRATLVARKARCEFMLNMASSGFTMPSYVELLIDRASKLGKIEGAVKEIDKVLTNKIFDLGQTERIPWMERCNCPYPHHPAQM